MSRSPRAPAIAGQDLGAVLYFKTEGYVWFVVLFGWMAIVGLCLPIGLIAGVRGTTGIVMAFVGVAMAGGAGTLLVRTLQERGTNTTLYERAAIRANARRQWVVPYDADLQVTTAGTRHYTNLRYTHTAWDFALWDRKEPNQLVKFSTTEELDAQTIEMLLRRALATAVMPSVLARLNSGSSVDFGRVSLSTQGLRYGRQHHPWGEIHSLLLQEGNLVILRRGSRGEAQAWLTTPLRSIPNFPIFASLASQKIPLNAQDPNWHKRWFGV